MSLNEVWEAASTTPFIPLVGKDAQFSVGFNLLLLALVTATLFGLSKPISTRHRILGCTGRSGIRVSSLLHLDSRQTIY
ncbi:unnamed protein product [Penicillium salamii]|uniref:Uncharacterized protein n=1 Tax=Penicillium salamii TaxID=1612424 RepID=A0A9W4IMV8_9EURO|nr:unnamed protein product [Penicillium salamii]CAG8358504.1 unnamed protein product [Penicillium salamii]CAG8369151.1 unnamed protein product [Penicillium salamii]